MTRTRRAGLAWLALSAAVLSGAACTETTDPATPFALEFTRLPWPSIVFGDSLRDSTGAVTSLGAVVFNSNGDTLTTATPAYVALDTGLVIGADGRVTTSAWRETAPRIVATLGRLQSRPLSLAITRRPDSVFAVATTPIVVRYDFPASLASNTSASVQVRVRSRQIIPDITGDSVTRNWPVSFSIVSAPARSVMDSVILVGESGTTPTSRDTTDASGTAGIRVRVVPQAGQTAEDSVVLSASVLHRGAPLPGSPVRIVVRLQRATVAVSASGSVPSAKNRDGSVTRAPRDAALHTTRLEASRWQLTSRSLPHTLRAKTLGPT